MGALPKKLNFFFVFLSSFDDKKNLFFNISVLYIHLHTLNPFNPTPKHLALQNHVMSEAIALQTLAE